MNKAILLLIVLSTGNLTRSLAGDLAPLPDDVVSYKTSNVSRGWESASAFVLQDTTISENRLLLRSQWDKDSLYVRFEMSDKELWATETKHDGGQVFYDDMCEILLDPRMDRSWKWLEDDFIYHVNILGTVKDDCGSPEGKSVYSWNGKASVRVQLYGLLNTADSVSKGYILDIAIPWSDIAAAGTGLKPRRGLKMGLNFGFSDRKSAEKKRCIVFYRNCLPEHPTRTPALFGTLVLK